MVVDASIVVVDSPRKWTSQEHQTTRCPFEHSKDLDSISINAAELFAERLQRLSALAFDLTINEKEACFDDARFPLSTFETCKEHL
jgi:hypothetical protein